MAKAYVRSRGAGDGRRMVYAERLWDAAKRWCRDNNEPYTGAGPVRFYAPF